MDACGAKKVECLSNTAGKQTCRAVPKDTIPRVSIVFPGPGGNQ